MSTTQYSSGQVAGQQQQRRHQRQRHATQQQQCCSPAIPTLDDFLDANRSVEEGSFLLDGVIAASLEGIAGSDISASDHTHKRCMFCHVGWQLGRSPEIWTEGLLATNCKNKLVQDVECLGLVMKMLRLPRGVPIRISSLSEFDSSVVTTTGVRPEQRYFGCKL